MVQNEVANRYSAKCGTKDYGYMTALLSYYYHVTKSFVVSRKCFDPVPNVDSAVIKFVKKDKNYSFLNLISFISLFTVVNISFISYFFVFI